MKEDIHYFLVPSETLPFMVDICGISYCDGSYHHEREDSPFCVMEYVVTGTGTVIVEGEQYTASAGDVYIIPLGSNHRYYSDKQNPWVKIFINAWGPIIPPLLAAYGLNKQVVFRQAPVERLFRELFSISGGTLPEDQRIEQCALKFHEILIALYGYLKKDKVKPDEALQLKDTIEAHMDHNFSISELAALIYRSNDYVIKLFNRYFGQTPHTYSTNLKMHSARRLLAETNMTITRIALILGYEDPNYFTHIFQRSVGMPPSAYRKQPSDKGEETNL